MSAVRGSVPSLIIVFVGMGGNIWCLEVQTTGKTIIKIILTLNLKNNAVHKLLFSSVYP